MPAPAADASMLPASALFAAVEVEAAATRRLLERYPEEHADWRPHEKSNTLQELARHVAELPMFTAAILTKAKWDGNVDKFERSPARTRAEMLTLHDHAVQVLRDAIASTPLDAAALDHEWTMGRGETVFMKERRATLVPRMLYGHIAHHRGQLGVYYRLLGVPVPGMYGPSKDDA